VADAGRPELALSPEGRRSAAAAFAVARLAHAGIAVSEEQFVARVTRCAVRRLTRRSAEPTPRAVADAIATASAADLYLVTGCGNGAPGAWERFQQQYAPRLVALARSRGAGAGEAEQRVADLLGDLAVVRPDRPSALEGFDGSGSLFGWLATCLLRRVASRSREAERHRPLHASDTLGDPRGADPVQAAERGELEGRLRRALQIAVDALTPQERAAVVLSHHDGWSGREVARILGVGAPRASRLRAQATEKVRAALIPVLRAEGLSGPPDGSSWEALRDAVGLVLAKVAIADGPAPLPGGSAPRKQGSDA
jgi:RNA polymerase sigma factor (sigma-70 family)